LSRTQIEGETVIVVVPEEAIVFPAAERLRANIMKLSRESECNVILDCTNLKRIDITVVKVGNEISFAVERNISTGA
jgi:MFS superfamily sulfate permease-like transporter